MEANISRETHGFTVNNFWDAGGRSYTWEFIVIWLALGAGGTGALIGVSDSFWFVAVPTLGYVLLVQSIKKFHNLDLPNRWVVLGFIPLVNIGLFVYIIRNPGSRAANEWRNYLVI